MDTLHIAAHHCSSLHTLHWQLERKIHGRNRSRVLGKTAMLCSPSRMEWYTRWTLRTAGSRSCLLRHEAQWDILVSLMSCYFRYCWYQKWAHRSLILLENRDLYGTSASSSASEFPSLRCVSWKATDWRQPGPWDPWASLGYKRYHWFTSQLVWWRLLRLKVRPSPWAESSGPLVKADLARWSQMKVLPSLDRRLSKIHELNTYIHIWLYYKVIEGSLEVKLLTIWTDGKADGKSQRREEFKKREDQRRERVRRKKMQVREKVGKSRFTVFFQWFVAPEGRKVGSPKRRVRSHLARWEMKNCMPLWREARSQASEHF